MKKILMIIVGVCCLLISGCNPQISNKTNKEKDDVQEKNNFSMENIKIDNYFISKTASTINRNIIIYDPLNEENPNDIIMRIFDLKEDKLVKEIKLNDKFDEIVCNDKGFYLYGSNSLRIYDYDGNEIKNIMYNNIFGEEDYKDGVVCISQDLNKIAFTINDTQDSLYGSYVLCTSNIDLTNKQEIMKISQKKALELQSIQKMYFSSDDSSILFLGLTFPSMKLETETIDCYGSINLSNKEIKLNALKEIDSIHTKEKMFVVDRMRDSYIKEGSGYVQYIDLDNVSEHKIDLKNKKSSEKVFVLSSNIIGCLNFDQNLSSKGFALDLYQNDKYIRTLDSKLLDLPKDPQNLIFLYNELKGKIIVSYYHYEENKFISELKYLDLTL